MSATTQAKTTQTEVYDTEARAHKSLGTSNAAIYLMVVRALESRNISGEVLVDVGCGKGNLWSFVEQRFDKYIGVDVLRYDGFPAKGDFVKVDLDTGTAPLADGCADVVASVETIEHLENPRAFMRELVRLAKPGGWVIVTTPNQLSLLSLLTLITKNQFQAFQSTSYPAHLTALLEIDLKRIAVENKLINLGVAYSNQGRVIFTPYHFPPMIAVMSPRLFSDNLMLIAQRPVKIVH